MKRISIDVSVLFASTLMAASIDGDPRGAIDLSMYRIEADGGGCSASNESQRLTARFDDGVTDFYHGDHRFSLAWIGAGRVLRTSVNGNRIELHRAGVTEWFINRPAREGLAGEGPAGLEHGFTFDRKPAAGPLTISLVVGWRGRLTGPGAGSPSLPRGEELGRYRPRAAFANGSGRTRDPPGSG